MKLKDDVGYFYDVEPVIDLEHFVELLFVSLASKSFIYCLGSHSMTAMLPIDYKKRIELVMYHSIINIIDFSKIIDIGFYYSNQSEWERQLGKNIENYLKRSDKEVKYDLEHDYIQLTFTKSEMAKIFSKYDGECIKNMESFIDAINNPIYDRTIKLKLREELRNDSERRYISELIVKKLELKSKYGNK